MLHLLIVEDDLDIRETLVSLLSDEGYAVQAAASQEEAFALIDRQTFALILTDLFTHSTAEPLRSAILLRARAHPTPVGVLTGWRITPEEVLANDLAFFVCKPFDLEELLTSVSASLQTPLSAAEERHAQVVRQYFARLSARDWDGWADLCTPDVTYTLPGNSALATTVQGKDAVRAYVEETFRAFQAARFEEIMIFPTPKGLAARYQAQWVLADGGTQRQAGAVVFQFSDALIRQIGVRLHDEQQQALLDAYQRGNGAALPLDPAS